MVTTRIRYTIYKPNPVDDGCSEPYIPEGHTVFSREEAKKLCPLSSPLVAQVALEEYRVYHDEYGKYTKWEALKSGSPWPEELHGKEPIESFLYDC